MIIIRVEGVEPLVSRMRRFPEKWIQVRDTNLLSLGTRIAYLMRQVLKPVRYTGTTEDSVIAEVNSGAGSVSIGPSTPQSLWIRTGTRPRWAPIAPLMAWAGIKLGDPKAAWAIRGGIHHHGTSVWIERKGLGDGHGGFDFPGKTLERGDTQAALVNTARRLGTDIAAYIAGDL